MAEITHFGRLKKELERLRAIEDRANAVFGLIDPRTVNEYGRGQYAAACAILAVDGPPDSASSPCDACNGTGWAPAPKDDVTAREVIAEALLAIEAEPYRDWLEMIDVYHHEVADAILAALAEAGYEVGRWEQVGWQFVDGDGFISRGTPSEGMDTDLLPVVPVFRRVEGGATGEQT